MAVLRQALQSKADRDYFVATQRLRPGDIYISRVDLNMEHGQIELPRKLILRVATPVMDSAGQPHGIFVISLLMRRVFDNFIRAVDHSAPYMMVMNHQGAWLSSPRPDDEAGFMQDGGITFVQRFPAVWAEMSQRNSGSILVDDGLWTWQTGSLMAPPGNVGTMARIVNQEPPWIVVSHVSAAELDALRLSVWTQFAPAALIGLALLAPISWLIVSKGSRPASALRKVAGDGAMLRWQWVSYALAVALPLVMMGVRLHLPASFGDRSLLLLLVFPISLCALLGGLLPGLIATVVAALGANYYLLVPYHSLDIMFIGDLFQWLLLIANGALISILSEGLRRARQTAEQRQLEQEVALAQMCESEQSYRTLANSGQAGSLCEQHQRKRLP